jgi:hypothetical protein
LPAARASGRDTVVGVVRTRVAALAFCAAAAVPALAADAQAQAELSPDAHIDIAVTPPEGKITESDSTLPTPPPEVPPGRPRHKGLVLETTIGALGFTGDFRHVAPTAPWMHGQLGYEILRWLMVFGEAEFAFTDTSEAEDPSHVAVFPLFGFGGGLRFTVHATERVALFAQGGLDALEAMVPVGTLGTLGYAKAESLSLGYGGRVGLEWYMVDRHMALTVQGGLRDFPGFALSEFGLPSNDLALLYDASGGFRYTF